MPDGDHRPDRLGLHGHGDACAELLRCCFVFQTAQTYSWQYGKGTTPGTLIMPWYFERRSQPLEDCIRKTTHHIMYIIIYIHVYIYIDIQYIYIYIYSMIYIYRTIYTQYDIYIYIYRDSDIHYIIYIYRYTL